VNVNPEIQAVLEGQSHLKAPFPWFGGKSAVADLVWERFGDVPNYVEPFFGSGAVLLGRPAVHEGHCETINDKDGYVANFWRAVQQEPEQVAFYADQPVNENDLHARHIWLVNQKETFVPRLEADPDFYDAKIAGWWCWGICCWIGHGFCSGQGPWQAVDGKLVHLGNKGQGVNRQRVHLGDKGRGVNRKLVVLTNDGVGCTRLSGGIYDWFTALCERMRLVRVCCGDWSRVCGPTPTVKQGLTGVFLDPPYAVVDRSDCYTIEDRGIAHEVKEWAVQWGDDPRMRIALCGYEGEHAMPDTWDCIPWKARGGYGSQSKNGNENCRRERIWFSPHCVPVKEARNGQRSLFGDPG
jgi:DNA adenine methylase